MIFLLFDYVVINDIFDYVFINYVYLFNEVVIYDLFN